MSETAKSFLPLLHFVEESTNPSICHRAYDHTIRLAPSGELLREISPRLIIPNQGYGSLREA
jgi:hypothetical protein